MNQSPRESSKSRPNRPPARIPPARCLGCSHGHFGVRFFGARLGTDEEIPIRDLVGLIARATGFEGEIRWDTTKPDGQPRRRVDPTRAASLFGFKAEVTFAEGLRRTVEWYLANREVAEARDR